MDVLAIDIGGTKHALAWFADGRLVRRATYDTDVEGGRAWMMAHLPAAARDIARDAGRDLLPEAAASRGSPRGDAPSGGAPPGRLVCGVGFGGPVDFASQRVGRSMHVGGWQDFPLAAALEQSLGVRCVIDNDANLGALGEFTAGAGRGARSLLYVTLSTGIGAGILLDGKIIRGADSLAGELGHIPLEADGPECSCGGRGCFEALCSGRAIESRAGRPARELLQDAAFRAGYVPLLARGLRAALMLLNPDRIVIGGGLSKAGEPLFADLRAELKRQIPPSLPLRVDVQPAALGDDSVLWGAAALAKQVLG